MGLMEKKCCSALEKSFLTAALNGEGYPVLSWGLVWLGMVFQGNKCTLSG